MAEPVTFRPRKSRKVCWVLAVVVVAVFSAVATALTGPTGYGTAVFQPTDQVAMILLGVAGAAGILTFTRPKVVADEVGVRIQNVIGGYRLPWQVIRAVRFERGNSWVTLELMDEDVVSVMAIQAADREYAVTAARTLRAMLAEHGGDRAGDGDGDGDGDQDESAADGARVAD